MICFQLRQNDGLIHRIHRVRHAGNGVNFVQEIPLSAIAMIDDAFADKETTSFTNSLLLCTLYVQWLLCITTHLLSIERADLLKLHEMFKARDAKSWQRLFPVGFPVRVCALNLLFFNIYHDVVACIESRCVIKAKHVLLVCWFVRFFAGKTALALKCSCIFPRKIDQITDQQDMFYYNIRSVWHGTWNASTVYTMI